MESYRLAENTTYPLMFTSNKITNEYSDNAYTLSKKRITLAGYRLANLVIKIYEDSISEVCLKDSMLCLKKHAETLKERFENLVEATE
jgi:hypothetical protein